MKIMNKDKEVFQAMCRIGHIRREQINSLRVNDNRIKTYEKEGLIKREIHNSIESFKLTREGHQLAEKEMNISNHYKAQSHNHDLGVADKYFELSYRERDTFLTEKDLQDRFEEHLDKLRETDRDRFKELESQYREHKLSAVDCAYTTSEGVTIGFEIVTSNYGKDEIIAKEEFCRELNLNYEEGRR